MSSRGLIHHQAISVDRSTLTYVRLSFHFVDRFVERRNDWGWGWENPAENREMGGHRSYHHQTSTRERVLSRSLKIQIRVGHRSGLEQIHQQRQKQLIPRRWEGNSYQTHSSRLNAFPPKQRRARSFSLDLETRVFPKWKEGPYANFFFQRWLVPYPNGKKKKVVGTCM